MSASSGKEQATVRTGSPGSISPSSFPYTEGTGGHTGDSWYEATDRAGHVW